VIGRDTPVLVVSPHLDDAVLSAFAFLQRPHATVLTVFCGEPDDRHASHWDLRLGQFDGVESMRTRVAEDDAALGGLGVATTRLPLLEAGYRDGEMTDEAKSELVTTVQEWLASTDGVVLAPAGAGAPRDTLLYRRRYHSSLPLLRVPGGGMPHADHVAVRDLVVPTVLRGHKQLVLYEELPYRWTGRGDRHVARLCRSVPSRAERFHVRVDPAAKARTIEAYASQTPELFRPWVRDIAAVTPTRERYWLLSSP
jgi:LmbE family N-acetylglucosaminyl deacetylase